MKTLIKNMISFNFILCVFIIYSLAFSDNLYSRNQKANKLYKNKKYEEALKEYDNLCIEYPSEPKLKINKGSALYKLEDYQKAEESYNSAKEIKDKNILSNLYYNLANSQFMQGEKLSSQDINLAMEKYKSAQENYIKALDLKPYDKDAKYNLELTLKKIKLMEQQKKNQEQNQQKKDNKENKQDKNQNNQSQNQKDNKNNQKQDNQQQQQNKENKDKQQSQQSQQEQKEQDMKKEAAAKLIEQYADDDKELKKNAEQKKGIGLPQKQEKDW